ncbi:hypothetical protein F4679DRAFT_568226 [Xylaria curta]|nr:hypothetical protein F4679DRAFT_568226 [Xylaria curta]
MTALTTTFEAYSYHMVLENADVKPSLNESKELRYKNTKLKGAEDSSSGKVESRKSTFLLYKVQPGHSLTVSSQAMGCSNSVIREDMWLKHRKLELNQRKMSFLSQLAQLCIVSGVRECQNKACIDSKERMRGYAPRCGWDSFRDWVLVAMSCQIAMDQERKQTVAHTHLAHVASSCCILLRDCVRGSAGDRYFVRFLDGHKSPIDLAGVTDLIYWMGKIQAEIGIGPIDFGRWDRRLLSARVVMPRIEQAVRRVEEMGLCKNRVWNLVDVSDRKEVDLPDIVENLERVIKSHQCSDLTLFHHSDHEKCVPSKCQWSQMNSAIVKQLHKCQRGDCGWRTFPIGLLETSLGLGRGSAWSYLNGRISKPSDPYIAISHVWSDGTGVGEKTPGTVSKCLFEYFADIAKDLGCTAVWWDAISIPQEPKARSKALNRLHFNYAKAYCTVVHDRYLLDFPWDDKGGPCLALVLSPWFTRGWTALELVMSHTVKVLFRNPSSNDNKPLIKDLDKDILAVSPGHSSRGHWLATELVQRLRRMSVNEAGDLLAVLRPRSTSWMRDRTVIAALLAQVPDCDFTAGESEITRAILSYIGHVPAAALLHGNPTMQDTGSFSWCAATLDDMPVDVVTDMGGGERAQAAARVEIDVGGGALGCWWARPLRRHDVVDTGDRRIRPFVDEGAAGVKIASALRRWRGCLLLQDTKSRSADDPVLLVMALGVRRSDAILRCRYIGAVIVSPSAQENDEWVRIWVQIGGDGDDETKGPVHARRALYLVIKFENENEDAEDVEVLANNPCLVDYPTTLSDDERFDPMPDPPYPIPQEGLSWYEEKNTLEYQQLEARMEDVAHQDFGRPNPDHLLTAVRGTNREAIRYLNKIGIKLTDETNRSLMNDRDSEVKYIGIQMLGDSHVENGNFQDAISMYKIAIEGYDKVFEAGSRRTLKAKHALGRTSMQLKEEQHDFAEKLFKEVLNECREKNIRGIIKKDDVDAVQHRGENAGTSKIHENDAREWNELKYDTIGDLTLLYAGQSDMHKAIETYKLAMERLGVSPLDIEAFDYNLATRASQLFEERKKRNEQAGALYQCAIKRLDSMLRKGLKEHALVLITVLNLGINRVFRGKSQEGETEDLLRRAYDGFQTLFDQEYKARRGSEHTMTLVAAHHLACLLDVRHFKPEAEKLHQQAVRGLLERKVKYGNKDAEILCMSLLGLGNHYISSKPPNKKKAREQFEMVENLSKENIGLSNKFKFRAMLGVARANTKKEAERTRYLEDIKTDLKRISQDRPDLDLCHARLALGQLYEDEYQLELAEEEYRASLSGYRALMGPDYLGNISIMKRLGRVCEKLGKQWVMDEDAMKRRHAKKKTNEAREILLKALEDYQRLCGPMHPPMLRLAMHLGQLCLELRQRDEAALLSELARDGLVKALGEDDRATIAAERALGLTYLNQWRLQPAQKTAEQAIAWCEQHLSEQDQMRIEATAEMGAVYDACGNLEAAERMYQQALEGFQKARGVQNERALEMEMRLGDLYRKQGKASEAEEKIISALKGFQGKPRCDVRIFETKMLLAHVTMDMKLAIEVQKEMGIKLDEDHELYIDSTALLGTLCKSVERGKYLKEALKSYEKVLVPGHGKIISVMNQLAEWYNDQGCETDAKEMEKCRDTIRKKDGSEDTFTTDHNVAYGAKRKVIQSWSEGDEWANTDDDFEDESEEDIDSSDTTLSLTGETIHP